MFAYLAAIEFLVFGDDDVPDVVDASRPYKDRAEDFRSEYNDGDDFDDDPCGLKYFCAIGDSERIECDVVIGTYFDFCAAAAVTTGGEESNSFAATVVDGDDKDCRVSSLASFKSFSASTSTFFADDKDDSGDEEEASNASPFTVFPDFKDVFKSSREGSSSTFTRASSAFFTAEDRSTSWSRDVVVVVAKEASFPTSSVASSLF